MKKFIAVLVLALFAAFATGCHSSRVVEGTRYDPIGLYHKISEPEAESPDVQYDLCVGNLIWSIILVETIVVPVILLGWYLWEPVGPNDNGYRPPSQE